MSTRVRADRRPAIERWLGEYRQRTVRLLEPLTTDDLERQWDPIMSPLVWDVGHVANFEELWLLRELTGRPAHDPALDRIYDPFDNPRSVRADLPFLGREAAFAYLADVRADALSVLERGGFDPDLPLVRDGYVWSMVAQHEAQHQETMLQAMDLRGDLPPYAPARDRTLRPPRRVDDADRVTVPAGSFALGTDDRADAYDNERPAHVVAVDEFAIDRFPASARRFAAFVADGGYRRPELWSSAGWAWLQEVGHEAPQGWEPDGRGGWNVRRFGHLAPLEPTEVVQHLSYWEAEAFCRFAGGRLPSEIEWEKAARWDPATGASRVYPWGSAMPTPDLANIDHRSWGPAPVGAYPDGASPCGVEQLVGDVYEWTSSDFTAYPGYATFPYPEYSEVFFGDDYKVLRGSSWATSGLVARATFRNWDYPQRRQIFSGVRVAYDAPGA